MRLHPFETRCGARSAASGDHQYALRLPSGPLSSGDDSRRFSRETATWDEATQTTAGMTVKSNLSSDDYTAAQA